MSVGRHAGGVLAPPIEDRLGAAIGEQISSVANALDDQRYRNVVDHQFKKFLGIFEFLGKCFAVGDVVEQRDQEFRLVVVVARDHAVGGKNPLLRTALDHYLVAIVAFAEHAAPPASAASMVAAVSGWKISSARLPTILSRESARSVRTRGWRRCSDRPRCSWRPRIPACCRAPIPGTAWSRQVVWKACAVRCNPHASPPNRHWAARNICQDRPAAGQLGDEAFRGAGDGIEILEADIEHAARAPHRQQFRTGHVRRNIRARQAINLEIAVVAINDPLVRIRHHHTVAEVVQGGTDERISAQLRTLHLAQRREDPQRDGRREKSRRRCRRSAFPKPRRARPSRYSSWAQSRPHRPQAALNGTTVASRHTTASAGITALPPACQFLPAISHPRISAPECLASRVWIG